VRPGRVVVLAALPLLALAGSPQEQPTLPWRAVAAQQVAQQVTPVVLVVTDGRPQPVPQPAHRPPAPRTVPTSGAAPEQAPPPPPRPRAAAAVPSAPAPGVPRVEAVRDGYPYAHDTTRGADPWGFTKRQCVSYVAWRLDGLGRPVTTRAGWGDASGWDDTARRLGRTVTTRPSLGAVAQWGAGEQSPYYGPGSTVANGRFTAGGAGHVAWVTRVYADGSVLVTQYNGTGDRTFSTMRVRAPRYLRL